MKILAADASGKICSAAVTEDGRLLAESFLNTGLTHSETLLRLCDSVLDASGISVSGIDCFAVTRGPGSFTGLRIAAALVKGMAFQQNRPCAAISTLRALAEGVLCGGAVTVPVIDARRDRVYCAAFERPPDGRLSRLFPDCVLTVGELKSKVLTLKSPSVFVGDAADLCYNALQRECRLVYSPEHLRFLRASAVAAAAEEYIKEGKTVPADRLAPLYMQRPQAERERELKMNGGKTP